MALTRDEMNRPIAQPKSGAELLLAAMRGCGADYLFANSGTDFPPIIEGLARAPETRLDMPICARRQRYQHRQPPF